MPEPKPPNVEELLQIVTTPSTRCVAAPLRNCDDCGNPAAFGWAVHIPALEGRANRTMAIVFYCSEHSEELDARLRSSIAGTKPD